MAVLKSSARKTVADPNAAYMSMESIWRKNRAMLGGERTAKEYDANLDLVYFSNLLVPFSNQMEPQQYQFYKAEAELPGITSEYLKLLIGALLRKDPVLVLPDSVPEEAMEWIKNEFAEDSASIQAFLYDVMTEELSTQRAWVYVDYPKTPEGPLAIDEAANYKPYPVIWKAEQVINWSTKKNEYGQAQLERLITREYVERYDPTPDSVYEFHPETVERISVHEVVDGKYQVRIYESAPEEDIVVQTGVEVAKTSNETPTVILKDTKTDFMFNDKPLDFIPAWPLNGSVDVVAPLMTPLIDKEVALYNKLSRRNHLLYGASTYTPYIADDMADEDFKAISNAGLGRWIHLSREGSCGVLSTPTEALSDLQTAIEGNIDEMAKLGVRMLTPETAQSGVALDIRNASQTAKLGALNNRASATIRAVITFMLNWRYDLDMEVADVKFSMSPDFAPAAIGETWLKLVTQWYQDKLIPRSVFLNVLSQNDILPQDYDDKEALKEINEDELVPENPMRLDSIGNPNNVTDPNDPSGAPVPKPKLKAA